MRAKFINEKFKENSDPIKDMGIGVNSVKEAKKFKEETRGNITITSRIYFRSPNHEGAAYVLHTFFRDIIHGEVVDEQEIQDIFYRACDSENFSSNDDWTFKERVDIANAIYKHHHIKVDPYDSRF